MAALRQPEYTPEYQPEPAPKQPSRRGHLKVVSPTEEEAAAANAGAPRKRGFVESLYRNWLARVVLTGGMILGAYEYVPPVRETIDNTKTSIGNYWNDFTTQREQNRIKNQLLLERPLGPQENEKPVWWQELPDKQIKSLSVLPGFTRPQINQLREGYASTVSPDLQEKAKQAGYKIIYQGNSNDTTGRTVVTGEREYENSAWSDEDLGFGAAGLDVRGIFKAWVPDPKDPDQKDHIYALLSDPISKKELIVRIELKPLDSGDLDNRPTWLLIDDLYNGPADIQRRSKEVGWRPAPRSLPSPSEPPMKEIKKLNEIPAIYDLLRIYGLSLTDLAKPGDYVRITMQSAGVDYTKGINVYKKDENGVSRAGVLGIRRFGGEKQLQSELEKNLREKLPARLLN